MREMREHRTKVNNKGLTLVEVVIAMCILAVAVTGIVTVLVTSVRFNAKANLRQHATLTAESILESFKAYEVKALCEQFHAGGFTGVTLASDGTGAMSVLGKSVSGGTADEDLFASGAFTESTTDEYEFTLTNIQTENSRYDATITVTPYMAEQSLVSLSDIHPYKDAVFRSSTIHDTKAKDQILLDFEAVVKPLIIPELNTLDQNPTFEFTEMNVVADFDDYIIPKKRVTTVTVDKSNSGYTTATVKMDYYFIVKDYPYYQNDTEATPTGKQTFPMDYATTGHMYVTNVILDVPLGLYNLNFYKNEPSVGLERVYFYYYPAYDVVDEIQVITNNFDASDMIDMYILKQVPAGADGTLNDKEAAYNPKVHGASNINLYHNFDDNIGGASIPAGANISGFADNKGYMDASKVKKNYLLMYNLNVEVREAGTANVVAALHGTKND